MKKFSLLSISIVFVLMLTGCVYQSIDPLNSTYVDDELEGCSGLNRYIVIDASNKDFKYSTLDQIPPEEDNLMYEDFLQGFDDCWPIDYVCKNGDIAKKVFLDYDSGDCLGDSLGCGPSSRDAIICGGEYVIEDFNLGTGPMIYGIYELTSPLN